MKIIAQVNQTGEVRLLSKLLNQKVDTVCCVCSGEKTLTVQGLWVCKKTGSLVEMHLQAPELLTFRYAYKTVLNQSKQKRGEKGLKQCCVDGRLHPHLFSLIYNSCQVASTTPNSSTWTYTLPALWSEKNKVRGTRREKEEEASEPLTSTWNWSSSTLSLTGLTTFKEPLWNQVNKMDGWMDENIWLDTDQIILSCFHLVKRLF